MSSFNVIDSELPFFLHRIHRLGVNPVVRIPGNSKDILMLLLSKSGWGTSWIKFFMTNSNWFLVTTQSIPTQFVIMSQNVFKCFVQHFNMRWQFFEVIKALIDKQTFVDNYFTFDIFDRDRSASSFEVHVDPVLDPDSFMRSTGIRVKIRNRPLSTLIKLGYMHK